MLGAFVTPRGHTTIYHLDRTTNGVARHKTEASPALAGNRTRIPCLEGMDANHYTTSAGAPATRANVVSLVGQARSEVDEAILSLAAIQASVEALHRESSRVACALGNRGVGGGALLSVQTGDAGAPEFVGCAARH